MLKELHLALFLERDGASTNDRDHFDDPWLVEQLLKVAVVLSRDDLDLIDVLLFDQGEAIRFWTQTVINANHREDGCARSLGRRTDVCFDC